jgi:hypothetical protein
VLKRLGDVSLCDVALSDAWFVRLCDYRSVHLSEFEVASYGPYTLSCLQLSSVKC